MRLPDFFIIGAMKAATSTLHDQLSHQSGFFMSDPKELYFFSDDDVWARGLDWYSRHFDKALATDLCGESSTHYAKLPTYPKTIERLSAATTVPRFIYIMRHPIDRLLSQYQHMTLEREIGVSFDQAIAGAVPELINYSLYTNQLLPYLEAFGPDCILPVFFDRLLEHPQIELERVCHFLGYQGTPIWQSDTESNVTSERLAQSPARERIKSLPLFGMARSLVPEQLIERVRDRWRAGPLPEMSENDLARITELFNQDLAELGSWLGCKLTCTNFRQMTESQSWEWSDGVPGLLEQN